MALAALSSQLGSRLQEFEGEYVWRAGPPCCCCACTATLVVEDRDSFQWRDARCKGIPCSCCLQPTHARDTKEPNWFVGTGGCQCYPMCVPCGDNDAVWVLDEKRKKRLDFHLAPGPKKGAAPLVIAMRRDAAAADDDASAAAEGARAGQRAEDRVDVHGNMKAKAKKMELPTREGQQQADKDYEKARKEEAKAAERAAINEAMTNAKKKEEKAQQKAKVAAAKAARAEAKAKV